MSHQKLVKIVASLIIEHTVNFALSGNIHGPCNIGVIELCSCIDDVMGRNTEIFSWMRRL